MHAYSVRYYFSDRGPVVFRSYAPVTASVARRFLAKHGFTVTRRCRLVDVVMGYGIVPSFTLENCHPLTQDAT